MLTMRLGEAVRRRRLELGITRETVAERMHCALTYPGMIETGERTPRLPLLGHLAQALETTATDLLRDVEL
jgi:transcriptional regulator with XRE-family HTH domain